MLMTDIYELKMIDRFMLWLRWKFEPCVLISHNFGFSEDFLMKFGSIQIYLLNK